MGGSSKRKLTFKKQIYYLYANALYNKKEKYKMYEGIFFPHGTIFQNLLWSASDSKEKKYEKLRN